MEVKLTMGEKLKDLRIEKKLTTKHVSQLTGISEAVYNSLKTTMTATQVTAGS